MTYIGGRMRNMMAVLTLGLAMTGGLLAQDKAAPFVDWSGLKNPVLSYPKWSIKDAAMAYRGDVFYVFFSAFVEDRGMIRSHVVEVSTKDFKHYSEPIFDIDGREDGWAGLCSPDVVEVNGEYVMTFNSWGDKPTKPAVPGKFNSLFYETSKDMVHWSKMAQLAPDLTKGISVIDAAIAPTKRGVYLIWKDITVMQPRIALAPTLAGPYKWVGDGKPELLMADGKDNGIIHENYEFLKLDGHWALLTTDYTQPPPGQMALDPAPFLYRLDPTSGWHKFSNGYKLEIPMEDFNHDNIDNALALYDWRSKDGYYYAVYGGRNDRASFAARGWNQLGIARSKDLVHWSVPGAEK